MGVTRKVMQDFTFSGGTFVLKGTTVGIATGGLHHDDRFYENAQEFRPFRFVDMEEPEKHQFVSTSIEYHVWGYGSHAWYGFFVFLVFCSRLTM